MSKHWPQTALTDINKASGSLAECKGQRSVDKIAQVGQQLAVVPGHQVTPFEVCVRLLRPVAEQVVAPDLHSAEAANQSAPRRWRCRCLWPTCGPTYRDSTPKASTWVHLTLLAEPKRSASMSIYAGKM